MNIDTYYSYYTYNYVISEENTLTYNYIDEGFNPNCNVFDHPQVSIMAYERRFAAISQSFRHDQVS